MENMSKKSNLVRVSINVPFDLVSRVKEYANNLGINVTSAYIVLINQGLMQKDLYKSFPMVLTMLDELKDLAVKLPTNGNNN